MRKSLALVPPQKPRPKFTDDEIAELETLLRNDDIGPYIRAGLFKIKFSASRGWLVASIGIVGWQEVRKVRQW
jgi:hypothetical protein